MPKHTATADPARLSPKVSAPAIVVLALTALTSFLAGITPDMLGGLGPWATPVGLGLALLAQTITGYLKSDPAREPSPPAEADPAAGTYASLL